LDIAKAVFEDDLSEDTAATCASLRNSTVKEKLLLPKRLA
jgi:hypothetical protein